MEDVCRAIEVIKFKEENASRYEWINQVSVMKMKALRISQKDLSPVMVMVTVEKASPSEILEILTSSLMNISRNLSLKFNLG